MKGDQLRRTNGVGPERKDQARALIPIRANKAQHPDILGPACIERLNYMRRIAQDARQIEDDVPRGNYERGIRNAMLRGL